MSVLILDASIYPFGMVLAMRRMLKIIALCACELDATTQRALRAQSVRTAMREQTEAHQKITLSWHAANAPASATCGKWRCPNEAADREFRALVQC